MHAKRSRQSVMVQKRNLRNNYVLFRRDNIYERLINGAEKAAKTSLHCINDPASLISWNLDENTTKVVYRYSAMCGQKAWTTEN